MKCSKRKRVLYKRHLQMIHNFDDWLRVGTAEWIAHIEQARAKLNTMWKEKS